MMSFRSGSIIRRHPLLIPSLALNLFLGAVVGGQLLNHRKEEGPRRPLVAAMLQEAEGRLAPADAARFHAVMERQAPAYMGAAMALSRARAAVNQAILAEPYDPAAVRAAIGTWRADWIGFTGSFTDTLVDALAELSPDGRRRIVSLIAEKRPALHP